MKTINHFVSDVDDDFLILGDKLSIENLSENEKIYLSKKNGERIGKEIIKEYQNLPKGVFFFKNFDEHYQFESKYICRYNNNYTYNKKLLYKLLTLKEPYLIDKDNSLSISSKVKLKNKYIKTYNDFLNSFYIKK